MKKRKNMELKSTVMTEKITEEVPAGYRVYLMDEERSTTTVEKYLRDVRVFLDFLGEGRIVGKEKVREYKQ